MERMNELAAYLKSHDRYAVIGHINPDGDAIGCAVASAMLLKRLGKQAFAFLPGGMPVKYSAFECPVMFVGSVEDMPFQPETVFTVDVSGADRMGCAGGVFEACENRAGLDHHVTNGGFGGLQLVDTQAAACGELVMDLYNEFGMIPEPAAATWIYAAVCTDSGRFGFSNTRSETLETAAACVRAGADVDFLTSQLYRTRTPGHTRLLGEALHALEMDETGKLCWSILTDEMFRRAGATLEDNEGIVNYLVEIEGVEAAVLAEPRGEKCKLSMRSNGKVDVAHIAQLMGGGGHVCAAGVTSELDSAAAVAQAIQLAKTALEKV